MSDPLRHLRLEDKHLEAMRKSEACRTLKMGALAIKCEGCGAHKFLYHTCKHRFCSGCGAANTYQWGEKTLSRLLEMPHHHIVMTLPKQFRQLSLNNNNVFHDLLFQSGAAVLSDFFKEKYNCLPGIISVLHTSGSDLKYHPHIHMIVSRGGKIIGSDEYKTIKGTYLVKNEILGKLLKRKFANNLGKLFKSGSVRLYRLITDIKSFDNWVNSWKDKYWIVNIEKPLEKVLQIVNYVGRYTKRACISEYRILSVSPKIKFSYKDYKNSKKGEKPLESTMVMSPTEFLDKLLLHVPTKGFRMVRYCGLYNSYYAKSIPMELRAKKSKEPIKFIERSEDYEWGELETMRKHLIKNGYKDLMYCYVCNQDCVIIGVINKEGEIINYDDSS